MALEGRVEAVATLDFQADLELAGSGPAGHTTSLLKSPACVWVYYFCTAHKQPWIGREYVFLFLTPLARAVPDGGRLD